MIDEGSLKLLQRTNDTLEGGGHVGKVSDATTNDQDLAIRMGLSTGDQINYRSYETGNSTFG